MHIRTILPFTDAFPISSWARAASASSIRVSCPVGINMRVFTKKLEKDCLELFGWEAGLDPDVRPPLDTYKPGDPDDFIK